MLGAPVLLGGLPHQNVLCVAVHGGVPFCCLDDMDSLKGNIAAVDVEVCFRMGLLVRVLFPRRWREWGLLTADEVKVRPIALLWLRLFV